MSSRQCFNIGQLRCFNGNGTTVKVSGDAFPVGLTFPGFGRPFTTYRASAKPTEEGMQLCICSTSQGDCKARLSAVVSPKNGHQCSSPEHGTLLNVVRC